MEFQNFRVHSNKSQGLAGGLACNLVASIHAFHKKRAHSRHCFQWRLWLYLLSIALHFRHTTSAAFLPNFFQNQFDLLLCIIHPVAHSLYQLISGTFRFCIASITNGWNTRRNVCPMEMCRRFISLTGSAGHSNSFRSSNHSLNTWRTELIRSPAFY